MSSNEEKHEPRGEVLSLHSDILKRCITGDAHAQMQIYNLYYKAMYNTAVRITNDRVESEDIMQEAFIVAFTRLEALNDLTMFPAWLKRIVVNKSVDFVTKRQHQLIGDEDYPEEADEEMSYDDSYTVELVRQAISQLADGYRIILSLYLLEGYDHEEISQILNITSSTSRSQYTRAKQKLRTELIALR